MLAAMPNGMCQCGEPYWQDTSGVVWELAGGAAHQEGEGHARSGHRAYGLRCGFTGTREELTNDEKGRIFYMLNVGVQQGATIITGGCVGVDAYVAQYAFQERTAGKTGDRMWKVHTIMPADRKAADPNWREHCDTWEEMPAGTTYKDRNQRIVDQSHALFAFPAHEEQHPDSRRSGSWQTVRMAQKASKPVRAEILRP